MSRPGERTCNPLRIPINEQKRIEWDEKKAKDWSPWLRGVLFFELEIVLEEAGKDKKFQL